MEYKLNKKLISEMLNTSLETFNYLELSDNIGISYVTMNQFKNYNTYKGKKKKEKSMFMDTYIKLCNYYKVGIDYFIEKIE